MPLTYNIKDAAQRLGVSRRWLREFLSRQPADRAGIPFYIPIGNRKRFTEGDLERILDANREAEKELLSSRTSVYPIWTPQDMATEEPLSDEARPGSRLARALVMKEQR